jgi:hypothetical protein
VAAGLGAGPASAAVAAPAHTGGAADATCGQSPYAFVGTYSGTFTKAKSGKTPLDKSLVNLLNRKAYVTTQSAAANVADVFMSQILGPNGSSAYKFSTPSGATYTISNPLCMSPTSQVTSFTIVYRTSYGAYSAYVQLLPAS